jgi:hypothetical protein
VVKDASEKLGCFYFEEQPTRQSPAKFLFTLQDGVRRQYREWRSSNEYKQTHPSMVEPACPCKDSGKGDKNCRAETRFKSVHHGPTPERLLAARLTTPSDHSANRHTALGHAIA